MIVYVEANFVLEIALEQEQREAAEAIVALAERGKIHLVFPNFILSEAFERLTRERRERNALYDLLGKALKSLQRSEPHKNIVHNSASLTKTLREAHHRQFERLHSTFERLFDAGECINANAVCFRDASSYQDRLALEAQDSIIYATIVSDLLAHSREEKKCFLSRDRKAFDNKAKLKAELETYNCRYIGSFRQCLDYIQNTLRIAE